MNILCIGDGDFTFSLAVARVLLGSGSTHKNNNLKSTIVATSYETLSTLEKIYGKDRLWVTLHELNKLGVKVFYEVDATKLHETLPLYYKEGYFHRIIWNFPCTAVENGQDGQNDEMEKNKELIRQFVASASYLLHTSCGEIHMSHKTKPPFDQWKIEEEVTSCYLFNSSRGNSDENKNNNVAAAAAEQDDDVVNSTQNRMIYCGRIVLDRCCFPPYTPRKAKQSKSFTYHDACIYVFGWNSAIAATRSSSLFPPTIPTNTNEQTLETNSWELLPVTNEMIQKLRSVHLWNASNKERYGKKKRKHTLNKLKYHTKNTH
jgi:hypothetical protein